MTNKEDDFQNGSIAARVNNDRRHTVNQPVPVEVELLLVKDHQIRYQDNVTIKRTEKAVSVEVRVGLLRKGQ